uniref:TIL domain-containing protein n=1 Tax=Anopheles funestus TaxID=62324 RepID=A0A182S1G6_ANOFN
MASVVHIIFTCSLIFCSASALRILPNPLPTVPPPSWCMSEMTSIAVIRPLCRVNEVYTCCGPCVQESCRPEPQDVNCLLACTEGCVCRPGFVRKIPGGICVPRQKCFKK